MPAEPPPRSFAQALAREILASERLRVTILIGILGFNKQFGSRLLVSEVVWRAAGEAAKDAVPLGPVPVKGHSAPVQVYRLA